MKRDKESKAIIEIFKDENAIEEAARLAFSDAVRRHKFANVPMVFGKNGHVVEIPADEIELKDNSLPDCE